MQEIKCRAILFDLDGVLVDSTVVVERQWCIWAEQHRLPCEVILAHAHGRRTIDTLRAIASHLQLDLEQEAALLEKREIEDTKGADRGPRGSRVTSWVTESQVGRRHLRLAQACHHAFTGGWSPSSPHLGHR